MGAQSVFGEGMTERRELVACEMNGQVHTRLLFPFL